MRLVVRIVLVCVLVVLLALVVVRRVPAIAAAIGSSPSPASTRVDAASTATTGPLPSQSAATAAATPTTVASPSAAPTTGGGTTQTGSGSQATVTAPKVTHAATHAPTAPSLRIDSLSAANVSCAVPSQAPAVGSSESPVVTIMWASTGADQAWFGVDTTDARANPYSQVDPDSNISLNWPCPTASEHYTVTVESAAGATVSKTITVKNTGYTGSGG